MEIGRKIIQLNTVDSTSNYIANLIKEGQIVSGTVILADEQTAGRGQRAANWESQPGMNLTFSFYLDNVNLSVDDQFRISQIVALSLIQLLKGYSIDAKIKWPNDIYVGNKKIAGVLIENQLQGVNVKSSIVGIGLNVNQSDLGELNATSIISVTGERRPIRDVLSSYIGHFNEAWNLFFHRIDQLQTTYLGHLLQYRTVAIYKDESGEFSGMIENVLPNGKLVVKKGEELKEYDLKEVAFIH